MALVVISGTLCVTLFYQARQAGRAMDEAKQASAMLTAQEQGMISFVNHTVAYGEKHPEFVPLLKKYGIAPVAGVPALPPAQKK